MAHWLVKSEPFKWSWDQQVKAGAKGTFWDGVRNHLAKNHLIAMKKGDQAFFYHSNEGKEIVGIVEVIRESAPDSTTDDPRWDCVMVRAQRAFKRPVSLEDCKVVPGLEAMALVKSPRLSVQPVTAEEWQIICRLGGIV